MRLILVSLIGSAVLAAGAHVQFPLPGTAVPQTGQTLAVVLVGALGGALPGAAAAALYLLLGAAALPVFAGGTGGIDILAGPTGGFLLTFPLAAAWSGWAARRVGAVCTTWWQQVAALAAAFVAAHALILLAGWARLSFTLGGGAALAAGVTPFLAGGLAKSVAGAALVVLLLRSAATDRVASSHFTGR